MHERLGHTSFAYLQQVYPKLCINLDNSKLKCEVCELEKHHQFPYPLSNNKRSEVSFSIIHTDVWGPSRVTCLSGARWFISFIDDCSRTTWVHLLKRKSETINILQNFYKMIQTWFGVQVRVIKFDNGTEYFNESLTTFFSQNDNIHQFTCVGMAERKNRHLLEVARALVFARNVPMTFWGDAILSTAYLINHMPSKALDFKTPIQTLKNYFSHIP